MLGVWVHFLPAYNDNKNNNNIPQKQQQPFSQTGGTHSQYCTLFGCNVKPTSTKLEQQWYGLPALPLYLYPTGNTSISLTFEILCYRVNIPIC